MRKEAISKSMALNLKVWLDPRRRGPVVEREARRGGLGRMPWRRSDLLFAETVVIVRSSEHLNVHSRSSLVHQQKTPLVSVRLSRSDA